MPLPQVNERIKEVPAQALRAVFAGIGQVLLVADKIRNRAVAQVSGTAQTAPPGEAPPAEPAPARPAKPSKPSAKPSRASRPSAKPSGPGGARWRSLDETGNVTLIPESTSTPDGTASTPPAPDVAEAATGVAEPSPDEAETPAPDSTPAPAEASAPDSTPAAAERAAAQAPAAPRPGTEPGALPLANYDELSVPSLRARLRVLSAIQVSSLLEYEKANAGRPEVITMFERRLAKLAQEDG
jgi:hypothetical protein